MWDYKRNLNCGIIPSVVGQPGDIDVVEFQRMEEVKDDYEISSSFPIMVEYHLIPMIEYRIQLLLKNKISTRPGETQLVQTACLVDKKLKIWASIWNLMNNYQSYLKFKGRINVKLTYSSPKIVRLSSSTIVGYLTLQSCTVS